MHQEPIPHNGEPAEAEEYEQVARTGIFHSTIIDWLILALVLVSCVLSAACDRRAYPTHHERKAGTFLPQEQEYANPRS